MKFFVKNKLMSLRGSSKVTNEAGEDIYRVKGKLRIFSPTKKKKIYDMDKKLIFIVRNKWFNWFNHRAYIFDGEKNKIATVKDKYLSLRREYFVEGYKDEIKFDGNFFSQKSAIYKNGEIMADVTTKFVSLTDNFVIDAKNDEDVPFLVALTIAIDNIKDNKTNTN